MKCCNFKNLRFIILLIIGVLETLVSNAQTYFSFEDATPPSGWTNTGSNPLTTDSAHYKLGRMALKWKWNARDTLKVDNPDTLLTLSSISSNTIGFYTWVYNENPKNDSIKFLITDAAKTVNLSFKMYINFKGWRCVYVDLKGDLKYSFNASKPLRYLNIIAPSTGNGNLYFDLFEMQKSALWNKGDDFFVNVDPAPPYDYVSPRKLNPDTSSVNLSDSVYANIIEKKLEAWMIDSSFIEGDTRGYLSSRVKGIQDWVKEATTKSYSTLYKLKFERRPDNTVIAYDSTTGEGMGLFPEALNYSQKISEYTNGALFQLAINYKIFKVQSDLQRCIDILDWMYDQGMADSSVMGSLYLQTVRLTALPQAFFILRNDLPTSTYNNTLNTIRWLIMFGTAYGKKYASMESKNADDIRGGGLGKLIYALSLKNQKERIVSLDSLQSFFNFAFAPAPGSTDIFKYDYSTYHHGGAYTSEYGDDALHQASIIYYFLDNTNFSLSEPTYNILRNTWIRYDLLSTNYGTPAGTGGRFVVNTGVNGNMADHVQALAALALTTKGIVDDSLKGTFSRLANVDTALLRANSVSKSSASIQYTSSIGAAKDLINALKLPIPVKDSLEPNDVQFMPYSGLFIHRNKGWLTTIRGFSKYIYDYECLGGDNYLGRYLSYGNMEISSTVNKKLRLVDSCYDWSHIAGTTVRYLPLSVIRTEDSLSSGTYWRFSDQTFLGGVRLNDSVGAYSMFLHNTTKEFDSTFRAKKSSFFFGDVIYNMGSSIKNTDNSNQTHTTLYQTLIPINSSPLVYINGVVDTISHNYPGPTNNLSIKDSWGNAYIVYGGNDSLYIKREVRDNLVRNTGVKGFFNRTYDAAYLSHGKSPNNKKYNYAVLLQPTQQEIDTLMNTSKPVFQVLRQDDSAHAVYNTMQGTFGFSFFTPTATLNYSRSILKKVYSPSILMESINSDSCSRTIAFTDPDLRRTAVTASVGDTLFGQYKMDSLDIAGKYVVLGGDTSDVSLTYLGSNLSRLYINASEGKMYKIQLAAINTSAKSVPFIDGSIAVVRLNSVSSPGNQVYVDEYDTLGNVIQTITLDSVYQPTANTSTEEGFLTVSGDGQHIGLTGYARISNGSGALYGSRFDTLNRAVAFIKYDGSVQRKNIMPSLDISKLFYPKSVYTSNGTDYWLGYGHLSGSFGGIMYGKVSASSKPDTLKSITPWATGRSVRQLNLNPDDSTLYFTQGSNQFFKFSSSTLPKDSIVLPATQPAALSMPNKGGAKGFFFVTNGNSKLLYVAYSATNGAGIIKYLKNASNGWDSVGYYDTASRNYLSISGRLTSNGVTIFAVRSAVNSNSNSALVKIIDTGSISFKSASAIVLDSGTNKIFRGVSVVPRLTLTIPNQTYGAAPFNLTPPASNVSGTFTYTSSNPSVATINGTTVTIVGAGTAVITAIQSSSANYLAGTTSATLTVAKASLTITANSQTVSYGSSISTVTNAATYTVNGLVNGDLSSEILNNLSYSTNFTNTTPVGASGIIITPIVSGLTAKNYTFNAASASITVTKATPIITTIPTASNITYGQTLTASILSGGVGSVAGSFAFTTPSTAPNAGTSSQSVTFTPTDVVRYNTVTINVNVTVVRAIPTITTTPTTTSLIYGQTLALSSLSGGAGSIPGTFSFTTPSTVPIVGTTNQSVTFTPADAVNYSSVTFNVTVTIVKAVPFTNGSVAVVRLSSVSGGGNQVYVDEYDTLGNIKQSIIMDSIFQPSANSGTEEGFMALSGDGQYIGLTGYARISNGSGGVFGSRFDTLNRAVEFIKYDGTVQRKNIMPSLDISKLFYPKSVYTSNGTDFWIGYGNLSGNYGGLMYGKLTSKLTPDTLKSLTPWQLGRSLKQLNLNPDDSTLYFTQGSSPLLKFSSSTLPTDSIVPPATQPANITMPSKGGAKSFFFVKRGASRLLYVAYAATSGGGIIKYLKNASNGWDSVGYYDTASRNYLSITGRLTSNGVTLFAVRSAANSNTNSALVRINDTGSAPFNLATSVRLDSGANKVFRGISIVPQTTVSPTLSFSVPSKTYGEAPFALTPPTSNSSGAFTYTSSNPAVATINGSNVTIVGAGTTIITATQAQTVYYLSGSATATLTVGKAALNITANTQSTNYGSSVASIIGAASYTVNGLQNGDVASVISGTVTYTTNYTNTTSVGSSGITIIPVVSGLTANNYTFNAVSAAITITKTTPTITTSPTASGITYGQTLAASILSGGVASIAGTFAFINPSTAPTAGTANQNVRFTPTDAVNYNTVTISVSVTVSKATPIINTTPTATSITYGQTLASSTLSGGVGSVAGSFAFTTPSTAPNAGTASQSVIFTPTDLVNYNTVTISVNVTVSKATPIINSYPTASGITYGQTLAASTLSGGVASVGGVFAFAAPSTVPSAGTASQVVIFTPTDAVNYNTVSFNVTVAVSKATPTFNPYPTASDITFGQTLASSVLSGGVASVSGTFAFTTSSTAPNVGTANQSVVFTPTDLVNFNTVSFTVSVTVVKATPTITTSPTATGITYGQTLASSTLSGGVASVAGTFAFTTPSTAPNAGTASQSVTFTPTNTVSYSTVLINVNVVVAKANTTISTAPTAAVITYGQTLSSSVLSGGVTSVAGTFGFTNPSTAPNTGTASQNVTFTPTDAVNYNTSTTNVSVTVIKATPTIVIVPTASNIMYGQTLAASALNGGVASVAGTFAFITPSTAPAVGVSTQNVRFTPTDVANNNTVTISVNVTTTSASPFTKGSIAVVRLASVGSAGNQVFVDEYDTLGNVKQSILLDSIYQPNANSSTEEGYLTLSGDGQYVGLTGYARTSNGSGGVFGSRFDTLNRAVALVKFDGSIQRKNIMPSLDISKLFYPKSVYTPNGTDFWLGYGNLSTNWGGLMYGKLTTGLTPDTLKSLTPWQLGRSLKQLNLNPDDSTLYFTQGSSPLLKFSSSTLPKDSIVPPATQPANITMPSKGGAKSFFFVKNGNSRLLYVAYSTTSGGGIIKYLKNASNGWDSIGYYDTASRNYLSVTGRLTSNGVTLFAVRSALNSNANSALVKINDTEGVPFNLATAVRLDSGANKIFRGVSIVPQTSTLPTMSFTLPAQTYGDAPFTITPPSSNSTGAITYTSSNPSVATINGTTVTIVGAGTTTITATQAATINYLAGSITTTLIINKAPLTITASNQSKNYGATLSLGNTSFTTSGLLFSDAVSSVTLSSAGAINTASATTYPIVPSAALGTGLSNYSITYNSGTLTVNKVVLTVTADSKNVSLGAAIPSLTSTFTGFVNSENVSVITGTPALATSYTSSTLQSASPIAITAAIGTLSSLNYSFNFVSGSITISCPNGTWTGLVSSDYTNTGNWCSATLPNATTNVFIFGAAPNAPTISGTLGVGNLTVQAGAIMTVTGTLKIAGNISNNGTIDFTNGTVELNGSAAQSIPANTFNTNTVKNITINNAAGVSLAGLLTVTGTVTPTAGILNTNGNLILKSDSVSTARIGVGTGNYISGNVTVQRYITAKTARKFSFIGSAIAIPIRNAWQQQVYITGAGTGGTTCGNTLGDGGITDKYNSNGFDVTNSNAASMFTYNAAPINGSRWVSVSNTKSTNLTPGIGYRVNVRGDRNSSTITCDNQLNSAIPSAPEAVTLSATGAVTMGDVTVNLNDTTFSKCTLLANPYPSQIDFTSLFSQNANLNNKMWTFSPFGNGNYTTYSQGILVNGADGYDNTNGGYLSSGQAFFVEANANGSVTFKENVKTSGVIPNTKYFGTNNAKLIRIGMKSTTNALLDEVLIRFNNKGSINYLPDWDAVSFSAANQSLIALKNNNRLAIATRPDTLLNDTTKLGVSSTNTGQFKLTFRDYAGVDSFTTITLRDKFLGINQDIRSNSEYVFNVTSDINSKGVNRFELIFKKGTPTTLPVTFAAIAAKEETGNVYVSWKVAQETNIAHYNVERSLDGRDFAVCASVKANNLTTYRTKDTKPFENNATIYYRVLAIGIDGSIVYSNNAKLVAKQLPLIALYPNPLKGNTVQVKMENMLAGKYVVNFINAIGQKVAEEVVIHTGNNGTYPINLKQRLAKGLYNVLVKDLNNNEKVFQLIVED